MTPAVKANIQPDIADDVARVVDQIVELARPLRVVLFGSAARGTAGPESDIDLLVVVPDGTHRRRLAEDLYEKIVHGRRPFDLLVTTPATLSTYGMSPGLIYRTIIREGVEVYPG
jgi:predicted nucleotidyltransferase